MSSYELDLFVGAQPLDPLDDNVDVEVALPDGRRYGATFFTVKNIQSLMGKWKITGEFANGLYLWDRHYIIVESLTEDTIRRCVDDLIAKDQLHCAFEPFGSDDVD